MIMRNSLVVIAMVFSTEVAIGENDTAFLKDDISMDSYLDALEQVAPEAREGTERYLEGFEQRCGRALTTVELRQAMASDSGDPVLMAMIRAAGRNDTPTLQRLTHSIPCPVRK